MQWQLAYYGRMSDMQYQDNLPWDRFQFFYNQLKETKKEERQAQEKAAKEQRAASDSMRSKSRRR